MLRDVSQRTLTTTVLGKPVAFPVGVSPTAMQRLAHPDGECANVRGELFASTGCINLTIPWNTAAASMGTIFILSTISTSSMEEIAAVAPKARKWYQLYVYKDRWRLEIIIDEPVLNYKLHSRTVTLDLVRRAEKNGFEVLVLTVDAPFFGKRRSNIRDNFKLPPHMRQETDNGTVKWMNHHLSRLF